MNNALYILGATLVQKTREIKHYNNFAIHRIAGVVLTDVKFDIAMPEIGPNTFGLPWHEPKTFRIRFAPGKASDYVRERIWADHQKLLEMDNGGIILELTTRSEPELMSWVKSFGLEATLEEQQDDKPI
jgi:hypothetical protein